MQPVLLNDRVERIKSNEQEINRFIEEYKPFIASCTEKFTGRYVRYGEDDELSIALLAFSEAIKSFSIQKGNFLPFAQNVIKRRLIDYVRKEKRVCNVVSINEYMDNEEDEKDFTTEESISRFNIEQVSQQRIFEIQELKKELESWDINFFELAEVSPKHGSTRKMCREILDLIINRPELVRTVREKKYLPIIEIEKGLRIPRKKIERMRKYIIAEVIIATGDYQYIREYIK